MKTHERIKDLRKNILHLSQKDFAEQINISRSNLGNIETNKINLTERVLIDICRTFHVNQDWLSNGIEPIFAEDSQFLDDQIVSLYSKLTDENKKYLYGYIQRLLDEQAHDDFHK
nr:helix-turn-helix transcriptional regulator [uncultured Acetatifactor sp.]